MGGGVNLVFSVGLFLGEGGLVVRTNILSSDNHYIYIHSVAAYHVFKSMCNVF